MTIGPWRSQAAAKSRSCATCSASGAIYPSTCSKMSWMNKRIWFPGWIAPGVSTRTSPGRQVTRCDASQVATISGTALRGQTWMRPDGRGSGETRSCMICAIMPDAADRVYALRGVSAAFLSCPCKSLKPRQERRLRRRRRQRCELEQLPAQDSGQPFRLAEVARGLLRAKAREHGCLVVSGDPVGVLDVGGDRLGERLGQTEGTVDGPEQLDLESLIVEADGGLERTDQVADDVLRRVVQQRRQQPAPLGPGSQCGGDIGHQQGVLGHREGVIAERLAVPARHPRQPVCDILDGDVGRRR